MNDRPLRLNDLNISHADITTTLVILDVGA